MEVKATTSGFPTTEKPDTCFTQDTTVSPDKIASFEQNQEEKKQLLPLKLLFSFRKTLSTEHIDISRQPTTSFFAPSHFGKEASLNESIFLQNAVFHHVFYIFKLQ